MQKLAKQFEKTNNGKNSSLLTSCLLLVFVVSESLKLDHFDEAGYTFLAPRLVDFPVISVISALNKYLI